MMSDRKERKNNLVAELESSRQNLRYGNIVEWPAIGPCRSTTQITNGNTTLIILYRLQAASDGALGEVSRLVAMRNHLVLLTRCMTRYDEYENSYLSAEDAPGDLPWCQLS